MPPMDINATEEDINSWGEDVKTWQKENSHIPNLPDPAKMLQNVKNRWNQRKQGLTASGIPAPGVLPDSMGKLNAMEAKMMALEVKLDKVMSHFGVK